MKEFIRGQKNLIRTWLAARPVRGTGRQNQTNANQLLDDIVVTIKVKTEILDEPSLNLLQLDVVTRNGIVQVSGIVDSYKNYHKAEVIVGKVAGVISVKNSLLVQYSEASFPGPSYQ